MTTANDGFREPLIHSHITDGLPDDHPLARVTVRCDTCHAMVHCENNECMQTWLETDWGYFCTRCMPIGDLLQPPPDALWRRIEPCKVCGQRAVTAFDNDHFCAIHADADPRGIALRERLP
jgi:hypothetical protein